MIRPTGVVGVTGHRNDGLRRADGELLRRRVDGVLGALATRHFRDLISGLAEGADRLVARRALAAGWTLRALLPFAPERYEADFAGPDSRADFRSLLRHSASVEVSSREPGDSGESGPDDPYIALGRLLVERAHLILAVWDGRAARGPGGTGDVVERATEAGRCVVWVHARPPHRVRFVEMSGMEGPLSTPYADSLGPLLDSMHGPESA